MQEVIIRECREADLARAHELYLALDPEGGEDVRDRMSEYFLVAEADGAVVGYVIAERQTIEFMKSEIGRETFPGEKEYLEVQDLYVVPECRGRGIGTKLMQTVLSRGRSTGLQRSMVYSANEDYVSSSRSSMK